MSKIITVLGNSNSGKTVFSYYLANKLAANDKRVIIVSTNNINPDVSYLLPLEKDKTKLKSLGRVLSLAIIDKQSILDNMLTFKNQNIGLLCYAIQENKNNYPEIIYNNMCVCFELLQSLVDYIIVDTHLFKNDIDTYAFTNSDVKFCITTADLKGLSYRQFINEKEVVNILFSNNSFNSYEDIKHTFKDNVKYDIPYIKVLNSIYNGAFLDDIPCPKKYDKLLEKIIKEEIEIE